jgi:hypothetical protein
MTPRQREIHATIRTRAAPFGDLEAPMPKSLTHQSLKILPREVRDRDLRVAPNLIK